MDPTERPDTAPAWGATNHHLASLAGDAPAGTPPAGPTPQQDPYAPGGPYGPTAYPPQAGHPPQGAYPAPGGGPSWGPPPQYAGGWGQPPQQWAPQPQRGPGILGYVATALVTALIVGSIAFAAGTGFGATITRAFDTLPVTSEQQQQPADASEPAGFEVFRQAWDILKNNYVDQSALRSKDLTYGAITGLTEAIGDTEHTRFLTPEQLAAQNEDLSGHFAGVGAVLADTDKGPTIQSVIPGTPAERAGVRAGDVILAVDGTDTTGKTVSDVVTEVRGPEGTQVTLTLLREGNAKPFDVTITREIINVPAVSWAMYPGTDVAVVRLEQFSQGSGDQVIAALTDAKAAGAKRIVFDLRNNPGGYVGDAVAVASQFLGDGIVYISQDAKGDRTEVPVNPGGVATDTPLVVLVDKGSASSAEIVSGAIKDAGRAKLVGETTFGTGTVLSQFDLSDGSALLVGTLEWLTPKGNVIWRNGVVPDVTVAIPADGRIVVPSEFQQLGADGITKANDAQLEKAIEVVQGR